MLLYLAQHGEAKREAEDPSRDLSEKGRQDVKKVAAALGKLKPQISQIWHSGKTRAVSTADILAGALQPRRGVAAAEGLAPLDDPVTWSARLAHMDEDIALVGHLPHLARLAGLLLVGNKDKNVIDFQMGGLVCLRRGEAGAWAVAWMLIPEIIP